MPSRRAIRRTSSQNPRRRPGGREASGSEPSASARSAATRSGWAPWRTSSSGARARSVGSFPARAASSSSSCAWASRALQKANGMSQRNGPPTKAPSLWLTSRAWSTARAARSPVVASGWAARSAATRRAARGPRWRTAKTASSSGSRAGWARIERTSSATGAPSLPAPGTAFGAATGVSGSPVGPGRPGCSGRAGSGCSGFASVFGATFVPPLRRTLRPCPDRRPTARVRPLTRAFLHPRLRPRAPACRTAGVRRPRSRAGPGRGGRPRSPPRRSRRRR